MSTPNAAVASPAVGSPEYNELLAKFNALVLKQQNAGSIVKHTAKGSLSMYGLSSKWPVTLTFTQWLIAEKQFAKVREHAKANFDKLYFASEEQRTAARKVLGL